MKDRRDRLKKLVHVQEQLKAVHEMNRAGHLFRARQAEEEARDIAARFDQADSLSDLFPELYHRRVGQATARQHESDGMARDEAGRIAMATARTNMVERAYREAARLVERDDEDKERLEIVERSLRKGS